MPKLSGGRAAAPAKLGSSAKPYKSLASLKKGRRGFGFYLKADGSKARIMKANKVSSGKKLNPFMKKSIAARKSGAKSFEYNGSTYKRMTKKMKNGTTFTYFKKA